MKLSNAAIIFLSSANAAFVPSITTKYHSRVVMKGYLDDISDDLKPVDDCPDVIAESHEATQMAKSQVDRFGAGSFEDFVDFDEFDGGDGQMGVAGDGNSGLDKMAATPSFAASKFRSAKNAWGTESGYAEQLRDQGVETSKAQQLENWHNQREVHQKAKQMQYMTEEFDKVTTEEDWRTLAKFGVERTGDTDLSETLGDVTVGQIDGTIELTSRMNFATIHEFSLKNDYMGFSDFRAVFTPGTSPDWTVEPAEGALSKTAVDFIVKFRPQSPGVAEGYLVIETEDFKKTYKLTGSTA